MANCTSNNDCKSRLNLLTYLTPGLPLELFQTYQHLFEEVLNCESFLSIESRWHSPPEGKADPFTSNAMDIAFMCSTGYVRLMDAHNEFMELLPVAPVYDHPNARSQPVYFSDVIVPNNKKEDTIKIFEDLRGYRWAANNSESLSGNVGVLTELRKLGNNASFFSQIMHTHGHIESIKAVAENHADAAAIDSNVLRIWLAENPEYQDKLRVLCSWGPYPVQPIVVNKRLPTSIKEKMTKALLNIDQYPAIAKRFVHYGIQGFVEIDDSHYNTTREIMKISAGEHLYPAYY